MNKKKFTFLMDTPPKAADGSKVNKKKFTFLMDTPPKAADGSKK